MSKVILRGDPAEPEAKRVAERSGAELADAIVPPLVAFGLVLVGVGMIDLGLVWWPLQLGNGEWEFGTASRTFNSLALGTTGFVFLVVAAAARGWAAGLKGLALLSLLGFIALVAMLLLFWLNVPVALGAIPEQTRPALERAILRSTLFAMLYIVLFGWMTWFTWRRAGAAKGAP